jgi:hypothetical protein
MWGSHFDHRCATVVDAWLVRSTRCAESCETEPLAAPAPRAAYLSRKVQQRRVTTTQQEAPHQSAQRFSSRLDLSLAVRVHVGFAGEGFSLAPSALPP